MNNQPRSLEELETGRQKAFANAADLVSYAEVLIEDERSARALFLAQIAGEEIGNYIILLNVAVESPDKVVDLAFPPSLYQFLNYTGFAPKPSQRS